MKLTKKQAYKLHYELWDWLYHHPSRYKEGWPQWEKNGGKIETVENDCFLCDFYNMDCSKCPLASKTVFFDEWESTKSLKIKKKYAKLIRDIVL